jgi:hypothetical protein
MTLESKRLIRCAIYTRKSSEEGLEQSFNSLDAQREACEANDRKAGEFYSPTTTTGDIPAEPWNEPPFSDC